MRMSNMVSQLLDLTRIRLAGGIPVERTPVDPSAVITEVVNELRLIDAERDILWVPGVGERCMLDPDRLAQVVSNLVGNALRHGAPSTPIGVSLLTGEKTIALVVHNHGSPIPL